MQPLLLQPRLFDDGVQPTDQATERRAERRRRRWRLMSRERKPIPRALAARLTKREQEAAELLYARWSPSEIALEMTLADPHNLLIRVYAEAEIKGGRGIKKQRQFIARMDTLIEEERAATMPAQLPPWGIQIPKTATG